jgi:membrane-associated phospholipid phosphatase
MDLAQYLTDFGNAVILVPLCLAVAVWIGSRVSLRYALLWLACVGAVTVTTALLKIWFIGCHYDVSGIHSPSGHTSFSVMAYGGSTIVLGAGAPDVQRKLMTIACLLWVLCIGITRVLVHAHTPQEVVAGYVVGGVGVAIFAALYRADSRPGTAAILATALAATVLAVLPLSQVSFESDLGWLGGWLVREFPICV